MSKLLITTALFLALGLPAHAVTATFCGPDSEGGTCEGPSELKVFLDKAKDTMVGFGDVGTQQGSPPVMQLSSDGGAMNIFIDLSSGFGTITPTQGATTFNGLDITIPGFTFTDIAFDAQLTPVRGQTTDSFTISDFTGAHTLVGTNTEFDAADTDKQFSTTATGGAFDEVNVRSLTGFDEIKHIEISGLAAIATPEPSTWAMLLAGFGFMGLMGLRRRLA
jgi:hypothetical protein